ncbi:MAG: hypothetical protein ACRD1Q_08185, partial [Vicinamibacterales bacterium]
FTSCTGTSACVTDDGPGVQLEAAVRATTSVRIGHNECVDCRGRDQKERCQGLNSMFTVFS